MTTDTVLTGQRTAGPDAPRRALGPLLLSLLERDPGRRADADAAERWLRAVAEDAPGPVARSPDEAALARLTRI